MNVSKISQRKGDPAEALMDFHKPADRPPECRRRLMLKERLQRRQSSSEATSQQSPLTPSDNSPTKAAGTMELQSPYTSQQSPLTPSDNSPTKAAGTMELQSPYPKTTFTLDTFHFPMRYTEQYEVTSADRSFQSCHSAFVTTSDVVDQTVSNEVEVVCGVPSDRRYSSAVEDDEPVLNTSPDNNETLRRRLTSSQRSDQGSNAPLKASSETQTETISVAEAGVATALNDENMAQPTVAQPIVVDLTDRLPSVEVPAVGEPVVAKNTSVVATVSEPPSNSHVRSEPSQLKMARPRRSGADIGDVFSRPPTLRQQQSAVLPSNPLHDKESYSPTLLRGSRAAFITHLMNHPPQEEVELSIPSNSLPSVVQPSQQSYHAPRVKQSTLASSLVAPLPALQKPVVLKVSTYPPHSDSIKIMGPSPSTPLKDLAADDAQEEGSSPLPEVNEGSENSISSQISPSPVNPNC